MLNRLRHRLGYLTLLVLFLPSLVLTSVGEARAHGAASMVGEAYPQLQVWHAGMVATKSFQQTAFC